MMCSFYTPEIYDRHDQLLNFPQKLQLFSVIYYCMDIIMGMIKQDVLIAYF